MFKYSKQANTPAVGVGRKGREFIYAKYLAGYSMEEISDSMALDFISWQHPDQVERIIDEINLAKNIW